MSSTGVGFRWLDILEKEFDKAYVGLDTSIAEIDADDPEIAYMVRQKMATLSSCFAQLSHKAQTIFQNSAKVEAELVDLRTQLVDARALVESRLHDTYVSSAAPESEARLRAECAQLARENAALRDTVLMLHGDLYGARLAAKYLDKELAGRIQQLQLLGREMRGAVRDRLWRQLEAEILLQRHKNVVRACRLANTMDLARPAAAPACIGGGQGRGRGVGEPRVVLVKRTAHQGLGISITGGREHGVPILISELEAGGPAAATGALYVGDAILAVNHVDLRQSCHREAVRALQAASGDCALAVQFVADDESDDETQNSYSMNYPLFPLEDTAGEVTVTPTAPRTPEHSPTSLQRRRWDTRSEEYSDYAEQLSPERTEPLHYVHTLPRAELAYHDYSGLGHHPILDMDDNNIKIETDIDSPMLNVQSCYGYDYSRDKSNEELEEEKDENFNGLTIVSIDNSNSSESPVKQNDNVEKIQFEEQKSKNVSDETRLSVDKVGMRSKQNCVPEDFLNIKPCKITDRASDKNKNITEMEYKIPPEDPYDQNSERNQNIGYLYPKIGSLQHFGLGKYQGFIPDFHNDIDISTSNDNSVESTPVHRRSRAHRKKPGDWKSKGSYKPVQHNSSDVDSSSPLRELKLNKSYRRDSTKKGGVRTLQHIFSKRGDVNCSEHNSDDETNINLLPNSQLTVKNGVRENSFKYVEPILVNKVDLDVKCIDNITNDTQCNSSLNCNSKESNHSLQLPSRLANIDNSEERTTSELDTSYKTSDRNMFANSDKINHSTVEIESSTRKTSSTVNTQVNIRSQAFRIGGARRIPPPPDVIHIPLKNVLNEESPQTRRNEEAGETCLDNIELIKFEPETIVSTNDIQNMNGSELSNLIYKSLNSDKDICSDDSLKQALSKLELSVTASRASHASHILHASHVVHGDGDPQFGTPV